MPSASGIAESTPCPALLPSSSPERMRGSRPSFLTFARKAAPLVASRTAAVATVRVRTTFICFTSKVKRSIAANARASASAAISPVSPTALPSPASTFSLKMTEGMRVAPE